MFRREIPVKTGIIQAPWSSCLHPPVKILGHRQEKGNLPVFLTHERGYYLGIGLRAVILATMMLSGRGVATALKVPFQNFSNSCFSPCCRLAILTDSPRSPGAWGAVRSAEMWIPNPTTRPGLRGAVRVKPPRSGVGERSEFRAGDGIEWDGPG